MMFAEPDEVEHPAVFITVKTTGKSYEQDEVIGFTAIDENGEVLMNKKFRPSFKELWYEKADNPTHIRPASVFGDDEIKPIDASAAEITRLLRDADDDDPNIDPEEIMEAEIIKHFVDEDGNDAFVVDLM